MYFFVKHRTQCFSPPPPPPPKDTALASLRTEDAVKKDVLLLYESSEELGLASSPSQKSERAPATLGVVYRKVLGNNPQSEVNEPAAQLSIPGSSRCYGIFSVNRSVPLSENRWPAIKSHPMPIRFLWLSILQPDQICVCCAR